MNFQIELETSGQGMVQKGGCVAGSIGPTHQEVTPKTEMAASFSCRTLPPWREDRWGFVNSAGFRHWLERITGDTWTWGQLQGIRDWLKAAKEGDELHLDSDLIVQPPGEGDIMIRCNRPIVM